MRLSQNKQEWEDLAALDPLWAILSDPARRHGRWDEDEFFRTGTREIERVMEVAGELERPLHHDMALDFGCGVGRLSRALALHFECCCGLDISESMIAQARALNRQYPQCEFTVNPREDLSLFADDLFDLTYSSLVLQHIPGRPLVEGYIKEFVRRLKPGGLLVFALPNEIHLRHRLQMRRRLYAGLRRLGLDSRYLYQRLSLHPIRMSAIPQRDVVALLKGRGAEILKIQARTEHGYELRTYYATK